MKNKIILISGNKRSGKDTLADAIIENNENYRKETFAGALKETVNSLFEWSDEWADNNKEVIDKRWGVSPRQAYQFFGTEIMQEAFPRKFYFFDIKMGRKFWAHKLASRLIPNQFNYIISDTRFPHEYEVMRDFAIKNNIDFLSVRVYGENKNQDEHLSEVLIDHIPFDFSITNEHYNNLNNAKRHLNEVFNKELAKLNKLLSRMNGLFIEH